MTPARRRPAVVVARVYDGDAPPGWRVLVDRLWPRGLAKEAARLDQWAKELAPSTEARKWYGHDPARFEAFAERYRAELDAAPARAAMEALAGAAGPADVVLLTATRDVDRSGAAVLAEVMGQVVGRPAPGVGGA